MDFGIYEVHFIATWRLYRCPTLYRNRRCVRAIKCRRCAALKRRWPDRLLCSSQSLTEQVCASVFRCLYCQTLQELLSQCDRTHGATVTRSRRLPVSAESCPGLYQLVHTFDFDCFSTQVHCMLFFFYEKRWSSEECIRVVKTLFGLEIYKAKVKVATTWNTRGTKNLLSSLQ